MTTKIINRIEKKIDQIEKLHDKESMLCEEVKDLLAELKENQEEDMQLWNLIRKPIQIWYYLYIFFHL